LKYIANKQQQLKLAVYWCAGNSAGALTGFEFYGEDECTLKDVMDAAAHTIFDPLAKDLAPVKGLIQVSARAEARADTIVVVCCTLLSPLRVPPVPPHSLLAR